jgi:undecaprenyl-diphosphatase
MNSFDSSIISFLNQFAHRSAIFDVLVRLLSDNYLLKGGFIVALIYWAWFRPGSNQAESRRYLLCGLVACLLSVFVARALAHELPFRDRPMRVSSLHLQQAYGDPDPDLMNWSSFPSDHAAVFFALATSIFLAWRAAGILAFFHVFFFICLPRIYLGYHYPTDILVGALIGIGLASLALLAVVRKSLERLAKPWLEASPGSFYACMFFMAFQISTLFEPLRDIVHTFYRFFYPR